MKQLLRFSFMLLALLLPAAANAHDFEVDGIYYNIINENEASVTYRGSYPSDYSNEYSGEVIIPSTVTYNGITYPVTDIATFAFGGCSGLNSVNIPNSVTEIGNYAFSGCSGLTSIDIPNSVTSIDDYAFLGCSGLTSINIPNSVTSIGDEAFFECIGLRSVTFGNSITSISWTAFLGCSELTSITVASDNTRYDSRDNCNAIIETASNTLVMGCKNTIIPNSVTSIGDYAFSECSGLTSIDIPNSVTSIGDHAFSECSGLTSIDIPNSVISIDDYAFFECSGLTSIDIPNSVTSISWGTFSDCSGLTSINIPNSVISIGNYAFLDCSGLTSIDIPNSVTSIGDGAFSACSGLTNVNIPNSVTTIGSYAFHYCISLTSVTIPNSVTSIGSEAFMRCIELKDVYSFIMDPSAITMGNEVFAIEPKKNNVETKSSLYRTLFVPYGTSAAYQAEYKWLRDFDTIVEMDPSANNYFFVGDTTAKHGDIITIPVHLTNNLHLMAFQTDVFLPEGFSIVTDEDNDYIVTPSERLTRDHVLMTNDANNGSVRVLCYTPNALPIGGNEGELFFITVQVPNDAEGLYTIALRNSLLTTTEYQEIGIPDTEGQMEIYAFIPGDVNDSRTVTVTDIVIAAQYVLDMNPEPFVFEAADMNGDGNVTVTDIMLIAYLINHPTMNAPKRMPVLDSGNDRMCGEGVTLMAGQTRTVSIILDNETDYTAFQLDLTLPEGLTASNFQLTDRAGNHAFDVNAIEGNKLRALCYSPAIEAIEGHEGALLTFDVTATGNVKGNITVDGIELVTADCQTVLLSDFTIGVNTTTSLNELNNAKAIASIEYFNLAGQRIDRPESGVTIAVTTYTDGTRTTTKLIK